MTTDQKITVSLNLWNLLWDVQLRAQHYLEHGDNTNRNRLDLAIQAVDKEAARERQAEQG